MAHDFLDDLIEQSQLDEIIELALRDALQAGIRRYGGHYVLDELEGWLLHLHSAWLESHPQPPPISKKKKVIGPGLRRLVHERDQYRCVRCGTWKHLTCDHIIPESKGGPTTLENLQTLCQPCNSSKGIRP